MIAKGHLISWPRVDRLNSKCPIDMTEAMAKGHLDQEKKNLQSTIIPKNVENDFFPSNSVGKNGYFCGTL
eukprot:3438693-Ditylum_brightwellii.AAC.1